MNDDFWKKETARRVASAKNVLLSVAATANDSQSLRDAIVSALVELDPQTPFVTSGFATKLRDFEKHISVSSGGDVADAATYGDFHNLKSVCDTHGSHVAIVIDAEGEVVCLAPVEVARLVARLLDGSDVFADDALPGATVECDA